MAIALPNGLMSIVSFLAVSASGATALYLSPTSTEEEYWKYLKDAGVRALITSQKSGGEARKVTPASTINIDVSLDVEGQA